VGQDYAYLSDSLYLGGGPAGSRSLCLANLADYPQALPVADDPRYRFYSLSRRYSVSPEGALTSGPERDIMGYTKNDPPRTISVDEALRKIGKWLWLPTPTPTR
jgi:hypothetical protein